MVIALKSSAIFLPYRYLGWNEKILQRSHLKWILLSIKITQRSRKSLPLFYPLPSHIFLTLLKNVIKLAFMQPLFRFCTCSPVISLTFRLSSWKGKFTLGKNFVRFSQSAIE